AVYAATVSRTGGLGSVAASARVSTVRFGALKGGVIDTCCSAANVQPAALGRATEAAVSLTVLILVSAVTTIRVTILDSRPLDTECAALKIDRTALGIRSGAIVEIA